MWKCGGAARCDVEYFENRGALCIKIGTNRSSRTHLFFGKFCEDLSLKMPAFHQWLRPSIWVSTRSPEWCTETVLLVWARRVVHSAGVCYSDDTANWYPHKFLLSHFPSFTAMKFGMLTHAKSIRFLGHTRFSDTASHKMHRDRPVPSSKIELWAIVVGWSLWSCRIRVADLEDTVMVFVYFDQLIVHDLQAWSPWEASQVYSPFANLAVLLRAQMEVRC